MERRIELLWGTIAKLNNGQHMKEHRHACYQLYYIVSGSPVYMISGTEIAAQAGSYFVVPEMAYHSMLPLNNGNLVCYEFKFLLKDSHLAQQFQSVRQPITDNGAIKKLLHYVLKNWNSKSNQQIINIDCVFSTVLMTFFLNELDFQEKNSRFVTTDHYDKVTKDVLIYIEQHYPENFSSERMAQDLQYNKNYLSTIFRKNTGYTIIEYLNMVRIRNAVIIFAYYDQDVSATSECVGFHDISYFSRTFRTFTGVSPNRLKKVLASPRKAHERREALIAPILNFQICSMDESFQLLRNLWQYCR